MIAPEPQEIQFARLVDALAPWLDQLVIIGGWAHRLYRLHPLAQPLDYPSLMTLDADVAVPSDLPLGEQNIRQRLLASGFKEERRGEHRPPVTHYVLGAEGADFYVEFLTPLTGAPHSRDKKPTWTKAIAGITTQKLRYLDLLLRAPWRVELDASRGFPVAGRRKPVQIPNAASYLAQKLLVYRKRVGEDQAKDALYIHDTIEVFARSLPEVRREWEVHVRPQLHPRSIRVVERAADALFGTVGDTVRSAALAAAGRSLSPTRVAEVCRLGLKEIFGQSERG